MIAKISIYALFALAVTASAQAKDFGMRGHVFPIEEQNLIGYLQQQMQKSPLSLEEKSHEVRKVPLPIDPISEATNRRVYYYDPSYSVPETILSTNSQVIAKKGTTINPLKNLKLENGLLILDGTRANHILWAKKQKGSFKWVLIRGNPFAVEEEQQRPIFFDQNGFITTKLNVAQAPARVVQENTLLKVEEIPLTEDGEEK